MGRCGRESLAEPARWILDALREQLQRTRSVEPIFDALVERVAQRQRRLRDDRAVDDHRLLLHLSDRHEQRAIAVLVEMVVRGVDLDAADARQCFDLSPVSEKPKDEPLSTEVTLGLSPEECEPVSYFATNIINNC